MITLLEKLLIWFARREANRKVSWSACVFNPHEYQRRKTHEMAARLHARAVCDYYTAMAEHQLAYARAQAEVTMSKLRAQSEANRRAIQREIDIFNRRRS